jgi:2-polyprenyl-6-methoxyphenol hydroxylase-like FAD-dependent oxidoreductase
MDVDVDRRRLQEEIVDLLGDGVYRFGSEVVGVEQDDASAPVRLADGGTATGDLVIAAGAPGSARCPRDERAGSSAGS